VRTDILTWVRTFTQFPRRRTIKEANLRTPKFATLDRPDVQNETTTKREHQQMGFFYWRTEQPTMPSADDDGRNQMTVKSKSPIYRSQRQRLQRKVVIDSLRPISRLAKGDLQQIVIFPLDDSFVPYALSFKTSQGTLTWRADRKMLRELYRTLREEFRPTKLNRRRQRELA
jgi:hypothetical protein